MLPLTLLTLVCVITYTIEITFGLAGTILMLMVLSFVFDTKTLVIYSILPQILVGSIGLIRSPKTVQPRVLAGMLAFAWAICPRKYRCCFKRSTKVSASMSGLLLPFLREFPCSRRQ